MSVAMLLLVAMSCVNMLMTEMVLIVTVGYGGCVGTVDSGDCYGRWW